MEGGLGGPERNVSVSGSSLERGSRDTMVMGKEAAPGAETTREDAWEAGTCVEAGASARVWAVAGPKVGTGTGAGLKVSVCTEAGARSEADDDTGAKVKV